MAESIPKITPEQFALWKYGPVTQTVFEYLKAYKHKLQVEHLDRWMNGEDEKDPNFEMRAKGVCIFVDEFLSLEYEELAKAYGESEEDVNTTNGC